MSISSLFFFPLGTWAVNGIVLGKPGVTGIRTPVGCRPAAGLSGAGSSAAAKTRDETHR